MHSIFRYVCLVVLTTLLNSSYIRAQTLYKCEVKGGLTSYQDRPCSEGKSTTMSSNLDDLEVLLGRGDVEGAVKYAQDHGISKEVLLELNDVLRSRELERERQRERQRVADLEAEDERQKLEQEPEEAAATNARFAELQAPVTKWHGPGGYIVLKEGRLRAGGATYYPSKNGPDKWHGPGGYMRLKNGNIYTPAGLVYFPSRN